MSENRARYPIAVICRVLDVSSSGYYERPRKRIAAVKSNRLSRPFSGQAEITPGFDVSADWSLAI